MSPAVRYALCALAALVISAIVFGGCIAFVVLAVGYPKVTRATPWERAECRYVYRGGYDQVECRPIADAGSGAP